MKPLVMRKPGDVRLSIKQLARETGATSKQVMKAVAEVQAKGFLDVRDFDGRAATFSVKLPKVAE